MIHNTMLKQFSARYSSSHIRALGPDYVSADAAVSIILMKWDVLSEVSVEYSREKGLTSFLWLLLHWITLYSR
jgi:hypothetical protein